MSEWLLAWIVLLGLLIWWDGQRARERAVIRARHSCRAVGGQFLDDSVTLRRLRPVRNQAGRLCLQRVFAFEFSLEGWERRSGHVILDGSRVSHVHLDLPEPVIETE